MNALISNMNALISKLIKLDLSSLPISDDVKEDDLSSRSLLSLLNIKDIFKLDHDHMNIFIPDNDKNDKFILGDGFKLKYTPLKHSAFTAFKEKETLDERVRRWRFINSLMKK